MQVFQVNMQAAVGGGEVYTRWFTRALAAAGAKVILFVDPANRFWDGLASAEIEVVPTNGWGAITERLPDRGAVIITQSRLPAGLAEHAASNHLLTGFAHMPMLGRSAAEFSRYASIFTVSRYCIDLLRQAGMSNVYPEPLYGTGEIVRSMAPDAVIQSRSPYHWDKRKGRDRLLALVEPAATLVTKRQPFKKRPGLTLGVVSLLSPIKQFPALFGLLAPHLARHPDIHLEIFGNGGYAQVRDLKRAVSPLSGRVRFWGYQEAVESIYPHLDYLLTGLPEKEALGLNVLEAQLLGTPVLAPRAPPFTETVVHGQTGFLYRDPREDDGHGFAELLASLNAGVPRPDPRKATEHLAQFTYQAMVMRAKAVISHLSIARSSMAAASIHSE